jgi:NitT/TauT family transport system ATP-binding protein
MDHQKLLISDLSHEYYDERSRNSLLALDRLSLEINVGEFVAVVGTSGCGKTTLLKIVAGLIRPTAGKVIVDGALVDGPTGNVGVVFQQPLLLPWRDLLQNVVWGLELRGMSRSEADARGREIVNMVGLSGFENNYPHSLSGGMQQRANLARALVLDPGLLLMDEPFASLDAQTREILQYELMRIWETTKKTILFVTHDIDEAVILADRVYVLTRRPARLKEVVDVELPRPRTPEVRRLSEFPEYVRRIWNLLDIAMVSRARPA